MCRLCNLLVHYPLYNYFREACVKPEWGGQSRALPVKKFAKKTDRKRALSSPPPAGPRVKNSSVKKRFVKKRICEVAVSVGGQEERELL